MLPLTDDGIKYDQSQFIFSLSDVVSDDEILIPGEIENSKAIFRHLDGNGRRENEKIKMSVKIRGKIVISDISVSYKYS